MEAVLFQYARPTSLAEAFALLRDEPRSKLLCGGTDLVVGLRKGRLAPPLVVDIKHVAELQPGISEIGGRLRIGATTVLSKVIADERVRTMFPALVEGGQVVGSIQIRNRATLAGNLCNASPAADTAPPLLVYGALLELVCDGGTREVALTDFFTGPGTTVLAPGELVSAISLPLPQAPKGAAFERMTRRRGVDLATVNLCCLVSGGETWFAFGAVGPRPFLVRDETGRLADPSLGDGERSEALGRLTSQASPISNVRASREYRAEMLLVLARRALRRAHDQLGGGHGR